MKYLVTGANGFLGSAIVERLSIEPNTELNLALRGSSCPPTNANVHFGLDLQNIKNWDSKIFSVDVVIHTAAKVHMPSYEGSESIHDYRQINTEGTLALARRAAIGGVKRFIFISTIKVNGEETFNGRPFTADDVPNPVDSYAISKYEAEKGLFKISMESKMDVVIIRPALIYGPGVKGNFLALMNYIWWGIPIPVGAIKNMRSFISIDNLVDLILRAAQHSAAANQIFLASDGRDLSTPQLINRIALAMGVKSKVVKVPLWLLRIILRVARKEYASNRILGSLQVDIAKSVQLLDWMPLTTIDNSLQKTAHQFKSINNL